MPSSTILHIEHKRSIWPYVQIARADHWFKNAFMLLGVLLAFFYEPTLFRWESILWLLFAFFAVCLIASSNYVLNELLDAFTDQFHPEKKQRPVPSGQVRTLFAVVEWMLLGLIGVGVAFLLNTAFAISALVLWIMGVLYNVPPVRTKDIAYLDVLSESANNPLRLFLGWFALIPNLLPPLSLILAYWMVGAFFMATKRFAEYRHINDPETAAKYRKSFRYYNVDRLLISMFFYATMGALFGGIFITRYHIELIFFVPVAAGFFAYYLKIGLLEDSPVQHPEKLYREQGFLLYTLLGSMFFILLMFTRMPLLYDIFNVEPAQLSPLWILGVEARR